MNITLYIAYSSFGSVLIPLTIAILQWNKLNKELKILTWILIVSLIIDSLSLVLLKFSINTLPMGNAYLLAQFTLLFWIFTMQFRTKKVFIIIYFGFVFFYIINLSFIQSFLIFNSNSNVVASLILMLLSLLYFYKLLNELPSIHIHQLPMLWISFGVLVYYSGTLFTFLASNYFFQLTDEESVMVWILHNLLNITKNFLFAIGLWQSYRKVRSSILSSSVP